MRAGRAWIGVYLAIGLAFQLLFFGLPWPQSLSVWLHVLGWPAFVLLGLLRRLFFLFALAALVVLAVTAWLGARRA